MDIKEIIQSTAALITALTALIAAVVSFIQLYRKTRPSGRAPKARPSGSSPSSRPLKQRWLGIGAALLVIAVGIFLARALLPKPSLNERLTTSAWDYFEGGDDEAAIREAEACISEFEGQALRDQQALSAGQIQPPPVGDVRGAESNAIFARGPLNDVATCYFIKGRALERKKRYGEAKEAYRKAQQFPHARTWDTRGWFWSPADAASDRLAQLP